MLKLHIQALLFGNACHMHQTRTVGTRDEASTSLHVPLYLVQSHLRTDGRFLYGEHATEAATFVRSLGLQDLNTFHQIQQVLDLVELGDIFLARATQPQFTDTVTGVVQAYLVGEGSKGMVYFHDIVQETSSDISDAADKKMTAVYLPYGSSATVSASAGNFIFSDITYSGYFLKAELVTYTYDGDVLSGTLNMTAPALSNGSDKLIHYSPLRHRPIHLKK